jgi:monoamine oxidase
MTIPVVIVGGGLAGLYAGYLLKARGIDFKILEAGDRLGGRILSKPWSNDADNRYDLDLGPTWFWPHQTELVALLDTLNIEIFEQYNRGDALFEADARSAVERFAPSYMESLRVCGGMNQLIELLADEIADDAVELNSAVSSIRSTNARWHISCTNSGESDFIADRVIIAAPPRVIVDKLDVADEGLKSLQKALARVPTWMAAQAKFVASYEKPFWREQGLSGQAFSHCGPMVEIHDASAAENDGFALFGFIGVSARDRINISGEDLKRACLSQLVKIFGEQAADFQNCYLFDWANQKFTASTADIHGQPEHPYIDLMPYRQCLKDNRLFIASSEVATQDPGYLRGAIVAANDAVREMF